MTIVYTCLFGQCDSLKPAPAGADRAVCFVDDLSAYPDPKGWELAEHRTSFPRRDAWQMRCLSHELFPQYDRVIWIDASFTLIDLPRLLHDAGTQPISALRHHERENYTREGRRLIRIGQARREDIEPQIAAYEQAGFFPNHLSIACVVVRDRSAHARAFNDTWDAEITRWVGDNTQVSLDYAAWVNGLTIHALHGTRHQNPYATHDHHDHKQRRKPYGRRAA